jgi:hypothetical protein
MEDVEVNLPGNPLPNLPQGAQRAPDDAPVVTPAMLESLKQTKPWVRFIAIMVFIADGLLFLAGLVLILGAGVFSSLSGSALGGAPLGMVGLLYAVIAGLFWFPALYLFRYASGIKKACSSDPVGGMEDALKNQKFFWRLSGVLLLLFLIFQVVALVFLLIYAVVPRMRGVA